MLTSTGSKTPLKKISRDMESRKSHASQARPDGDGRRAQTTSDANREYCRRSLAIQFADRIRPNGKRRTPAAANRSHHSGCPTSVTGNLADQEYVVGEGAR